ncbi:MAG: YceI family protein [Candidatus Acidiferrales bacterium]
MAKWTLEPGHTAAEFRCRHMMVTWVRGHFKNVRGRLEFDPQAPARSSVDVTLETSGIWTGEPQRDDHLRSPDFLDAVRHPEITFRGQEVEVVGDTEYRVTGELTLRGVSRQVTLDVQYLGQWQTPWWENGVDKGPKTRAGFVASAKINRHDFGVSWNAPLDRGGVVVGHEIFITLDAEAILEENEGSRTGQGAKV